jgi:hypothetical protein
MSPGARQTLSLSLGVAAGAVLFFLCFGAIFSGIWSLLLLFALCFAACGAVGVAKSSVSPFAMATALSLPAIPWVLWLAPAAIAEAGIRGLLWPGFVLVVFALAYLGGFVVARRRPPASTEHGAA